MKGLTDRQSVVILDKENQCQDSSQNSGMDRNDQRIRFPHGLISLAAHLIGFYLRRFDFQTVGFTVGINGEFGNENVRSSMDIMKGPSLPEHPVRRLQRSSLMELAGKARLSSQDMKILLLNRAG